VSLSVATYILSLGVIVAFCLGGAITWVMS